MVDPAAIVVDSGKEDGEVGEHVAHAVAVGAPKVDRSADPGMLRQPRGSRETTRISKTCLRGFMQKELALVAKIDARDAPYMLTTNGREFSDHPW